MIVYDIVSHGTWREYVVERICGTGRFWVRSEGVRESCVLVRAENQQRKMMWWVQRKKSRSQIDWDDVDEEKLEAGSRETVRHIEINDQLLLINIM